MRGIRSHRIYGLPILFFHILNTLCEFNKHCPFVDDPLLARYSYGSDDSFCTWLHKIDDCNKCISHQVFFHVRTASSLDNPFDGRQNIFSRDIYGGPSHHDWILAQMPNKNNFYWKMRLEKWWRRSGHRASMASTASHVQGLYTQCCDHVRQKWQRFDSRLRLFQIRPHGPILTPPWTCSCWALVSWILRPLFMPSYSELLSTLVLAVTNARAQQSWSLFWMTITDYFLCKRPS